jgi:hypothetical protein
LKKGLTREIGVAGKTVYVLVNGVTMLRIDIYFMKWVGNYYVNPMNLNIFLK